MLSTMQDVPLTVARILEHGATVHGASTVATWNGERAVSRTFAEIGARSAQLAHALRDELGVTGDQRVATLMWNNTEHQEAYLAVPSMGAVLHTLNIRLSADQVGYIATHAGDHAVIVDASLIPLLAKVLPLADVRVGTPPGRLVPGAGDDLAVAEQPGAVAHDHRDGQLKVHHRAVHADPTSS